MRERKKTAVHSGNDLYGCKIQFPAGFAKDTYSYDEYFKRYGRFEYHMGIKKMSLFGQKVNNLPESFPRPGEHIPL